MNFISVIGSLNIDLVVQTNRTPKSGETVAGSNFIMVPGGKGANQAIAASRSGVPTRLIGCVGNDPFGTLLLETLKDTGVDITGVYLKTDIHSGIATIIVESGGENRIIVVSGANQNVTNRFIDERWDLVKQSSIILLQNEIPVETVFEVINKAHRENIPVIYNPSPIYAIPKEIYKKIEYLIVNESEATDLTGINVHGKQPAIEAAKELIANGVKTVIVTLGKEGSVLVDKNQVYDQKAYLVDAIDATAAGDTFAGAFAAKMVSSSSTIEALQYATAASALAVTIMGAQPSIPNCESINMFMKNLQ